MEKIYNRVKAAGVLDKILGVDMETHLPGDLLVKADRMTMVHSLEGRSPFLDHEFVAWAARLPERCKRSGRVSKYLLRKAARGLLPPEILKKGKQGFGIPVGAWFRGPLRAWSRERLLQSNARVHSYFKSERIEALLDEHADGRINHGNRLWALIMLELWLQHYRPLHP